MVRVSTSIAAAVALIALGGCRATIPQGVYVCESDDDCPPGQSCLQESGGGVCRSAAVDAGSAMDAGVMDADTMQGSDGGNEAGSDGAAMDGGSTVPVRFVNASSQTSFARFESEGTSTTVEYGTVSEPLQLPRGNRRVTVQDSGMTGSIEVSIELVEPSIVVLHPTGGGEDALQVFPDVPATDQVPVLHALTGPSRDMLVANEDGAEWPLGDVGATSPGPMELLVMTFRRERLAFFGNLRSFFEEEIPPARLTVLAGDLGRPPDFMNGPRAILVTDTYATIPPAGMLQVANFSHLDMRICLVGSEGSPRGPLVLSAGNVVALAHRPGLQLQAQPVGGADPCQPRSGPFIDPSTRSKHALWVITETRSGFELEGPLVAPPIPDPNEWATHVHVGVSHFAEEAAPRTIRYRVFTWGNVSYGMTRFGWTPSSDTQTELSFRDALGNETAYMDALPHRTFYVLGDHTTGDLFLGMIRAPYGGAWRAMPLSPL